MLCILEIVGGVALLTAIAVGSLAGARATKDELTERHLGMFPRNRSNTQLMLISSKQQQLIAVQGNKEHSLGSVV